MDHSSLDGSLEEFMKNNEEIPKAMIQDLRSSLEKGPLQRLHSLESEIKDLEERLCQLKIERIEVQEEITRYDCAFSPIRRLPVDILHEIFYHCLPIWRNPIMSSKEAPILLTRICQKWRQAAYACPRLWSRLYITFSNEDMISQQETQQGLTKKYISNLLSLRCSAVEEWLSRSGACPLSISIQYTTHERFAHSSTPPLDESDITSNLLHILARFSSRWQNLELSVPMDLYRKIEGLVTISQLSMLNSLRISHYGRDTVDGAGRNTSLLEAQNLTKLSFTPSPRNVFDGFPGSSLVKLTNLACQTLISVSEVKFLLQSCPGLQYVTLSMTTDPHADFLFLRPPPNQPIISLPHLRALSLNDLVDPFSQGEFYDLIEAPKLEWMVYRKTMIAMTGPIDNDPSDLAITALLYKSKQLKKLTIEAYHLGTATLRQLLRSAESITHLVFGPEKRTNERSFVRSPNFRSSLYSGPMYDLGDLFLQSGREELGSDSISTFLPKLQVLEISNRASKHLRDDTLRDIILRRTDPALCKNTALLKKIVVLFDRVQELKVSKVIYAHFEITGHQFELELEYVQQEERPKVQHYASPDYGIDSFDRTWYNEDIEDEM